MPGRRIGRFELLRRAGEGGVAWVARDLGLDREVALEVLPAGAGAPREALLRSAQALARLSHPSLLAVHEVLTEEELLLVVRELARGPSLRAWLAAAPRNLGEVLDAFGQAGRALSVAGAAGLGHPAFSADDAWVDAQGRVRVAGFELRGDAGGAVDGVAFRAALAAAVPSPPRWLARELNGHGGLEQVLQALSRNSSREQAVGQRLRTSAALALLAVAASGLFAAWHLLKGPPKARQRPTIAILGPRNASEAVQADWLSPAFADMLGTELASTESLRLVPGRNVAQSLADLGLPLEPASADLRRLHERLGADLVLAGSYAAGPGGALRLDLQLWNARSGERFATLAEVGEVARLFDLVARAGVRLRQALGIAAPARAARVAPAWPREPDVERLLAEGLGALDRFEPAAAVRALSAAAAQDPGNARVLAALARALADKGDVAAARATATRALAAPGELGREERLRLERIVASPNAGDWKRALEISTALFAFYPDDVEAGLQLGNDLGAANRLGDALHVVDQLHRLTPPVGDDPRIDNLEASITWITGDRERSLRAAERAAQTAGRRGMRLVKAKALAQQGTVLRATGAVARALAAFADAAAAFEQLGERRWLAGLRLNLAEMEAEAGRVDAALVHAEAGLALGQAVGDANMQAVARLQQAEALRLLRRHAEALAALALARDEARRLGRQVPEALALHGRGEVLTDLGELGAADAEFEAAMAIERATAGHANLGKSAAARAQVAAHRGELLRARALCELARGEAGEVAAEAGRAALCLARVDLQQGHAAQAAEGAADAAALYAKAGSRHGEAQAQAIRALALLVLGRPGEAAEAADRARGAAAAQDRVDARTLVALAAALVKAAQPVAGGAALGDLRLVAAEADRSGSASDRLEARLALGEQLTRSSAAEGTLLLAAVADDAASRGFALIERRARGALEQPHAR